MASSNALATESGLASCHRQPPMVSPFLFESTGRDIPAYTSIAASMASWPETATAVGVRLTDRGAMEFVAPYGLVDLFALTVRPSPAASDPRAYTSRLRQKAWLVRWPRLRIV